MTHDNFVSATLQAVPSGQPRAWRKTFGDNI